MRLTSRLAVAWATGLASLSTILLAPGAVQAQAACSGTAQAASYWIGLGATGCTIGDKLYSDFSFDAAFQVGGATYALQRDAGTDRFTFQGLGFSLGTGTHNYGYTVAVTAPSTDMFDRFRTNVGTSDDPTPNVSKTLALVVGPTNYGPSTSTISVGNPGTSTPGNVVNLPNGIYGGRFNGQIVVGADNTSTVDTMTDSLWQRPVPGPLPILGAGAAFGFTRKLRRRIKASA